jgi:hypothetical protein
VQLVERVHGRGGQIVLIAAWTPAGRPRSEIDQCTASALLQLLTALSAEVAPCDNAMLVTPIDNVKNSSSEHSAINSEV